MELQLQNAAQHKIADLLWVAQSQQEVDAILRVFGHDARVVHELMIAATFDNITEVDQAESILKGIMK